METLRKNIVDTVNELNKLLLKAEDDGERRDIRSLRKLFMLQLEEVIKKELDANAAEFQSAIASLQEAKNAAVDAKADIDAIADAINRAVAAARAVDKVVNLGVGLFG